METELKFIVPRQRLDALAADMRRGEVHVRRLLAIYYDTVDGRLAARNVSIRLRREGRRWVQTAKALTPDSLRRLEHNVERTVSRGFEAPEPDLGLHDGTPAGLAIRDAIGVLALVDAQAPLVERFRADVSRMTRVEQFEGARVELALDSGKIVAGSRSSPVREFELELKSGVVPGLLGLAADWAGRHGLWLSTLSKAQRGMRLAADEKVHAVTADAPMIGARAGPERFLVAVTESCLRQILGNANEIGAGAVDEELVHQLRVGLRRLRTALRELADFSPGLDPAWEQAFRSAFHALGAHRDEVTVLPGLRKEMTEAGIVCAQTAIGLPAAPVPETVVRDPEFQRALLGVMAFCHATPTPLRRKGARQRLKRKIGARLAQLHQDLKRDARGFDKLSPSRQHRVRKRLKRLRYLAEFASPLFGAKRVGRYLKHWREAQDALGDNNDYRVGLDLLRAVPQGVPSKRAARWISARVRNCVQRCDRALRKAAKAPVFWKH
jgi:triphosphatase